MQLCAAKCSHVWQNARMLTKAILKRVMSRNQFCRQSIASRRPVSGRTLCSHVWQNARMLNEAIMKRVMSTNQFCRQSIASRRPVSRRKDKRLQTVGR